MERALVVSGLGSGHGGLFRLHGTEVERLTDESTTGLAVDRNRFARVLWDDEEPDRPSVVIVRDADGERRMTVPDLREPHGLLWRGRHLLAVSTIGNAVLWLRGDGSIARAWRAGPEGDAWHINGVLAHRGRLLATAFGRFDEHRGWSKPGARDRAGVVFRLRSGRDVLQGFTAPHDPLWLDGRWIVCNSGTRELWVGERRVQLGGWTRGLTYDDRHLYVGVSAHRLLDQDGRAVVVTLDRQSLEEVARTEMPCGEVFALRWAPRQLL
jgi:hypothetical protein